MTELITELTIDALGQQGDGLANLEGKRFFVPFTLPGERVSVMLDDDGARLIEVLDRSPDRAEPICRHFTLCGGCSLQHLPAATYAALKRDLVVTALGQAGVAAEAGELVDARGDGRRRASLHVRKNTAGYMRARSHDVLDLDLCPILAPALRQAAPRIARALWPLAGDCDASFTATDTGIDLSIKSARKLRSEALAGFAGTHKLARVTFNGEPVYMQRPPVVRMGKAHVELPPGSFLQATASAEETLARLVLEALGPAKSVADLFCGVGPFALRIAETARVYAADSDKPATEALRKAANHSQGLKPITVQARDLFRDPLAPVELKPFDAVVFDPPRAGAEKQARELAQSAVKRVVAVSCDPRSFARDAAILVAGGYRLETVTPVDQFAYSTHVELVARFSK